MASEPTNRSISPFAGLPPFGTRATLRDVTAVLADARTQHGSHAWNIGLAYCGDAGKAGTWSGTPASLGNALRGHGASVVALKAQAPAAVETLVAHTLTLVRLPRIRGGGLKQRARLSRTISLYTGQEMSVLRSRGLRAELRRAQPLDAVVQIQTNYAVPAGLPVATLEDMTVVQALEIGYPEWTSLSRREQRASVERQRRAYERAAVCCFMTQWAADSAVADHGIPPEKTRVVGVGRNHAPAAVDRDWNSPRYLAVGGDWGRKNGAAVVRAFQRVRERIPEARLDLVGIHPQIDVVGVHGHGWLSLANPSERERLDRLFESATCFVMPSLCEPCGIAYVEAAAAGVPSIGTTVGGSSELICDGGLVVDPYDQDALFAAMLELADGETAQAAGQRALARSSGYTWAEVARRILAALELHC
jgi:glycosyltransferase involved in cell wall biosynthesis